MPGPPCSRPLGRAPRSSEPTHAQKKRRRCTQKSRLPFGPYFAHNFSGFCLVLGIILPEVVYTVVAVVAGEDVDFLGIGPQEKQASEWSTAGTSTTRRQNCSLKHQGSSRQATATSDERSAGGRKSPLGAPHDNVPVTCRRATPCTARKAETLELRSLKDETRIRLLGSVQREWLQAPFADGPQDFGLSSGFKLRRDSEHAMGFTRESARGLRCTDIGKFEGAQALCDANL